jgi:hypothetical protein
VKARTPFHTCVRKPIEGQITSTTARFFVSHAAFEVNHPLPEQNSRIMVAGKTGKE